MKLETHRIFNVSSYIGWWRLNSIDVWNTSTKSFMVVRKKKEVWVYLNWTEYWNIEDYSKFGIVRLRPFGHQSDCWLCHVICLYLRHIPHCLKYINCLQSSINHIPRNGEIHQLNDHERSWAQSGIYLQFLNCFLCLRTFVPCTATGELVAIALAVS